MSNLTQERLKEILDYDFETGIFKWKKITGYGAQFSGREAGTLTSNGYLKIGIDQKRHRSHRLAWLYVYGYLPLNDIDHINGIRTDNRIINLREVTRSENLQNIKTHHIDNKSGLLGVSYSKAAKSYVSQISINGKYTYLGCFKTKELAHLAYLDKKREIHSTCTI
jgi:hypothetical protein